MTLPRTYTRIFIATAVVSALSACVVRPNEPDSNQYSTVVPGNAPANNTQGLYYYRGTTNNTVPTNNDAALNANVVQAISRMPSTGARDLQVITLNGVVTLRGVADDQATAQSAVEAARQVPGVLRVDYDIQLRRQ